MSTYIAYSPIAIGSLVMLLASTSLIVAGQNKIKTAKSAGNDQTTFVMNLNASKCPFCNTTETAPGSSRKAAASYFPALIRPGVCGQSSAKWELNADPFVSGTFFGPKGFLDSADSKWTQVVSGLYVSGFSDLDTNITNDVATGDNAVKLTAAPEKIAGSIHPDDLVVVDTGKYSELAKVVKVDQQTLTIQGAGSKSGWQFPHSANVPLKVVKTATDCEGVDLICCSMVRIYIAPYRWSELVESPPQCTATAKTLLELHLNVIVRLQAELLRQTR